MNPMGRTIENHVSCSFNVSVSEKKSIIPKISTRLQRPKWRLHVFNLLYGHGPRRRLSRPGGNKASDRRVVRYGWLRWCYGFDLTSCVFISFTTESCKQQNNKGSTKKLLTTTPPIAAATDTTRNNEPTTRPDALRPLNFWLWKKVCRWAHGSLRSSLTGAGVRIMCNFAGFQLIAGAHTV